MQSLRGPVRNEKSFTGSGIQAYRKEIGMKDRCCWILGVLALACSSHPSPKSATRESSRQVPLGYLVALGGGATYGAQNQVKPAQTAIFRSALNLFESSLKNSPSLPKNACHVDYHEPSESQQNAEAIQDAFESTGIPVGFQSFVLDSVEKANDPALVQGIFSQCGLINFPGGDQTIMTQTWSGTLFARSLPGFYAKGGGLMGKSAGAAILGSLVFLPVEDTPTEAVEYLRPVILDRKTLSPSLWATQLKQPFAYYIETHTGDRERLVRATAMLAHMKKNYPEFNGNLFSVAVDSDTAALVRIFPGTSNSQWKLRIEVAGARNVEVIYPKPQTIVGFTKRGSPVVSGAKSDLLLPGDVWESHFSSSGAQFPKDEGGTAGTPAAWTSNCLNQLEGKGPFDTSDPASLQTAGGVSLVARDPNSQEVKSIEQFPYAYLTGRMEFKRESGCGYFSPSSFANVGQPENRLYGSRFILSQRVAPWSVQASPGLEIWAEKQTKIPQQPVGIRLKERNSQLASSSYLVQDISQASFFKAANYVYSELENNAKPLQTGGWRGGMVHLVPLNSVWIPGLATVPVTLP